MLETWVPSLSGEVSLEKGNDNPLSIRYLEIPWTEESGEVESIGSEQNPIGLK